MNIKTKFLIAAIYLLASSILMAVFGNVVLTRASNQLEKISDDQLQLVIITEAVRQAFSNLDKDIQISLSIGELDIIEKIKSNITQIISSLEKVEKINKKSKIGLQGIPQLIANLNQYKFETPSDLAGLLDRDSKLYYDEALLEKIRSRHHSIESVLVKLFQNADFAYKEAVQQINSSHDELKYSFFAVFIGYIVISALVFFGLISPILRRIDKINKHFATTDINKLDPLEETSKNDELSALTKTANSMISAIKISRSKLVDKEFVDQVIDNLGDMLFILDDKFSIIRHNPSAINVLKLEDATLIERDFFKLTNISHYESIIIKKELKNLKFDRNEELQGEFLKQDGNTIPFYSSITRFEDTKSKSNHYVVICRDMTNAKMQEEQRRKLEAQIIHNAKLASLGTLGAGIAHELNNPLQAVRGYAEIMLHKMNDDDQNFEYTEKIFKATDRMKAIIDHVRQFASDSSENKHTDFDINTCVENSLTFVQNQLTNLGVNVILDFDEASVEQMAVVHGDQSEIESVFNNLLSNSRDAFSSQLDNSNKLIIITSTVRESEIVFSYKDNAGGIPTHLHEKIFDPFFSTKETGKGTGIGLHLCHSIMNRHKGDIQLVESEKGTTNFIVKLPISLIERKQEKINKKIVKLDLQQKPAILAVDDEEMILEVLSEFLGDTFDLTLASSGEAAIEIIQNSGKKFDLLLTDIKMPGINGMDLIKRLEKSHKDLPKVALTGHAYDEREQNHLLGLGAKKIISKPISDVTEFISTLSHVIKNHSKKYKSNLASTIGAKMSETNDLPQLLLVENEAPIIEVFETILSDSFNIHAAATMVEIGNIVKNQSISYAIVDLNLGDIDGRDVVMWLSKAKVTFPIFIGTGAVLSDAQMQELRDLGATGVIEKPYDFDEIKSILLSSMKEVNGNKKSA